MPLCLAFAAIFQTVFLLTDFLTSLHNFRLSVQFPFELSLPFVPAAAPVYLSITPLLLLAPFIFRTRRDLMPLFVALTAEVLIAAPFFILLPLEPIKAPFVSASALKPLFVLADSIHLTYNCFPSLHVAFAFTAAFAYGARCSSAGRFAFLLWAFAIAVSTLLIRAHYVVDALGGFVLAVGSMRFVYGASFRRAAPREISLNGSPSSRIPLIAPRKEGNS